MFWASTMTPPFTERENTATVGQATALDKGLWKGTWFRIQWVQRKLPTEGSIHVRRILKVQQHQRRINIKACAVRLSRQNQGRREQSKGWKSSLEHIKDDIALIMSYEPKTTLLVMAQQPLFTLQKPLPGLEGPASRAACTFLPNTGARPH